MILKSESDIAHKEALLTTGFWGAAGAGCIFFAKSTQKFLIPLRGQDVLNPNCWGNWGGAIDIGESPTDAVKREVKEEAGYHQEFDLIPVHVFTKGAFNYHNFIAIVEHEFEPVINWETADYGWFHIHDLPQPLHFGWDSMLRDSRCMALITDLVNAHK